MSEQQILKKFEELGYEVIENCQIRMKLKSGLSTIQISKIKKVYKKVIGQEQDNRGNFLTVQEHQLLHELFKCWGWFDEN